MIPKKLQNRSMATLKTPYQGEMGTWLWQELHASAFCFIFIHTEQTTPIFTYLYFCLLNALLQGLELVWFWFRQEFLCFFFSLENIPPPLNHMK